MQIKTFFLPLFPQKEAEDELNRFLRGNKVLTIEKEFCSEPAGWCFCVSYLGGASGREKKSTGSRKEKVDYREVLSAEHFLIFTKLRKVRKAISDKEAIPAYAVFTDAELAGLAGLKEISLVSMKSVSGIGLKKVEKFGQRNFRRMFYLYWPMRIRRKLSV